MEQPILAEPIQRAVVAVHAEIQAEFEAKLQAAAVEAATTITALKAELADRVTRVVLQIFLWCIEFLCYKSSYI